MTTKMPTVHGETRWSKLYYIGPFIYDDQQNNTVYYASNFNLDMNFAALSYSHW